MNKQINLFLSIVVFLYLIVIVNASPDPYWDENPFETPSTP
jgi:hypothetical protein